MLRRTATLVLSLLVAGCAHYQATIRWTSYGIPHLVGESFADLGYGSGYAFAADGACVFGEQVITVRGLRSLYFGKTRENLNSDVFHRALFDEATSKTHTAELSRETRDFLRGYVAGYNRFLRTERASLSRDCRDAIWLQPITVLDKVRAHRAGNSSLYMRAYISAIADAHPPGAALSGPGPRQSLLHELEGQVELTMGSNAIAVGGDLSRDGRGVLLGNPHFPWHGASRFYLAHFTIPGIMDVMGTTGYGGTYIGMGFNRDVAWTHTVTFARHYTIYELDLVEGDPLSYHYDGDVRHMKQQVIEVPVVRTATGLETERRTVYWSHFGPIAADDDNFRWTARHAYAIRDANYPGSRILDQYNEINKARSVGELRRFLAKRIGVPWTNTIAVDRHGDLLYADVTPVPNVPYAVLNACISGELGVRLRRARIFVLDGSTSACEWRIDKRAPAAGILSADQLPITTLRTYAMNSNDSYWLANPDRPLVGYPELVGDERTARSLRTRAGITYFRELLGRVQAVTPRELLGLVYADRNYAAELFLDDALVICSEHAAELSPADAAQTRRACEVLSTWDRHANLDSRGQQLFHEFWLALAADASMYAIPFDPSDPVNTPRGLKRNEPAVIRRVLTALATSIASLERDGISPDARWGDLQFEELHGKKIPLHGGPGSDGLYGLISAPRVPGRGYTPVSVGNSFIQATTFDEQGPRSIGLLTYGQSSDTNSIHSVDQMELYARKGFIEFPFGEAEILADPKYRVETIFE